MCNPYAGAPSAGLRPRYPVYLATLAAKALQRWMRLMPTRQQMFSHLHRPEALQSVALDADAQGRQMNYVCNNASAEYSPALVDTYTPGDMRAPARPPA